MTEMVGEINYGEMGDTDYSKIKRLSVIFLLGYALLMMLSMWFAANIDNTYATFKSNCEKTGGIITFEDQRSFCTRIRSGGMLQL